jgi:PrtD family type I secretion system ABC transporter
LKPQNAPQGLQPPLPMRKAINASRGALIHVAMLSCLVNVLMLTSSLFMMQVYDRVLSSRSVPTLITLSAIAVFAYLVQWLFDVLRHRMMGFVAERIEQETAPVVQRAAIEMQLRGTRSPLESLQMFRDMESVRGFAHGQGPLAFFDLPWIPIYLAVAFILHPWLGWATVAGIVVLTILTIATEWMSREPTRQAMIAQSVRNQFAENMQRGAEVMRALGMEKALWARWNATQDILVGHTRDASHKGGILSNLSKTVRYVIQSAVLALGAYLVLQGQLSGGAIIAGTILAGRAMAPLDLAIASWRPFIQAREGYRRLSRILPEFLLERERMPLPPPKKSFVLQAVDVAVPGQQKIVVRGVSVALQAGDALGIIGHSASGKSSVGRAMVGLWPAARGRIMLDGAALDNYDPERLGPSIGYMPQDVQLFDGTIAENISRFQQNAKAEDIIAAAQAATFHDYVLSFPDGYDTKVGPAGAHLSAGQRQRLGLARALYGSPFLVVLDEPNANLDNDGEVAVSQAIKGVRDRGGVVIVIAHRPSAISQVNLLMVMRQGEVVAVGPRDEVLAKTVKNAARVTPVPHLVSSADAKPQTAAQ